MRIINNSNGPVINNALDIPVGTVFSGKVGMGSDPSVYLRSYDNIVDLANPKHTWDVTHRSGPTLLVANFQELSAILTVGPKGTL